MKLVLSLLIVLIISFTSILNAQTIPDTCQVSNSIIDSMIIAETEEVKGIEKVLHAEPLYIDLIRDLGARKGERELNVGFGMRDRGSYVLYEQLVEYEWAPINRLGLEVELPFTMYQKDVRISDEPTPANQFNGLKLAAQYSFYVSEKRSTSLALGYIHEFEATQFREWRKSNIYEGNLYNPFLVAAKRWGTNWHTLLYTGPTLSKSRFHSHWESAFRFNSNFHYMITGTKNFVGVEINKIMQGGKLQTTLRPQLRVSLNDNMIIGIVSSIAMSDPNERLGTFFRLIYEPPHRKNHS